MCDSRIANSHHKIWERLSDADDVGDDDEVDIGGLAVDESDEKEGEYWEDDEGWQEAEIWVSVFLQSGPKFNVR